MEKIEEKLWKEHYRSSLRFDTRFPTESIILGNHLARICLQTAKSNIIEENDNGVYVLWLTNEEKNEDQLLKKINIKIFHSNDNLIDFMSDLLTSNVFLIIDHELVSNTLSFLDDFSQIVFIYVLTNEKSNDTLIISDSRRSIRKISNDKEEISRLIIKDIDICTKDSLCTTIFDLTTAQESTDQTKNTSFIWYYLLVESLFDIDVYNDKAKSDLIQYCRQIDNIQQDAITQFDNNYSSDDAIRWYTRDSFIYRQLNKAFRTCDIDAIFKFRFFIIDFQKQLEQHYNEKIIELLQIVYRGQQISQLELIKLQNSIGKYISFNTYLSASIDKKVAEIFAGQTTMSVLFEFNVNSATYLKNKRARPIYVQDKSDISEEYEVIFPIGSTFHVDSISTEDKPWHIKLKLVDDNEYNQMIDLIQTLSNKNTPSKVKFANLLLESGDYEKAERYIEMLIEDLELAADNINIGYAYDLLGQIWTGRGGYQSALSYFEKALNNIQLENVYHATIYRHIGSLHREKTEFDIALKYLHQSLEYKEQMDPLELAELYEAFGSVYTDMKNFDDALFYVNQALTIRQSSLSTNNVLGYTYVVLALIYSGKSDYTEALQFSKRALNILSEIVPKDHPILITIYAYIGHIYFQCKDLSSAMIYTQKALYFLKTADQKQNLNPTVHIAIYNILFQLYNANKDISNALYYEQQAYDIYNRFKNIIPETRSMIRTLYNNLGVAYYNVCDFTLALNFFLQALNLYEDTDDKIIILCQIGQIYLDQSDTKMAGQYLNDLPQLVSQRKQPIMNDDTLFLVNYNISRLYELEKNLEKSLFYIKEVLRLEFEQTNKNYDHIAMCYVDLMELCPGEEKEHVEELLEIVQKHDLSITIKALCHKIIGRYHKNQIDFYNALYHKNQNDFYNALYHFQLSLDYELTCIPSRCENLITLYSYKGSTYKKMEGEDSDTALSYYEKSRYIYLELLNMKETSIKDKKRMIHNEEYVLEDIKQHSTLILSVFLVYNSIAIYYIKKGDHEKALNYLQTIYQIVSEYNGEKEVPMQDIIYYLIGSAYESMQHYDDAIFFYEKRLTYISNDYNTYGYTFYLIAHVYYERGEYLMAISKCKISLTFLYNSELIDHDMLANSYMYAALSYHEMNNYEYALIYCKKILEHCLLRDPINYSSIAVTADFCASFVLSMRPQDSAETSKYLLTALEVCENHLNDSQLKKVYSLLGLIYCADKKYDNGLLYHTRALEYDSKESEDVISIYKQKWLIYMYMGELDQAYDTVKNTINKQFSSKTINFTDISDSYINMGVTCHQHGKYKLALKSYRSAFYILEIYQNDRQHKNYARIYNYIGYIYLEYGQITDACNYCLKVQTKPSIDKGRGAATVTSYIILGLIECKLENYYVALDYFGQAWEHIFNQDLQYYLFHRILYNHIGYVYFKLGQTEIAMKNYLTSASLYSDHPKHPDLAQVYKNIGLIYEHENDYPTALSCYRCALDLVPNKKHPHCILYKSMIITLELKLNKTLNCATLQTGENVSGIKVQLQYRSGLQKDWFDQGEA